MPKEHSIAWPWSHAGADGRAPAVPAVPFQADKKLPAIQGLRGLAVLLVVLFHALTRYVPFGWIGVWLFFAISGFVITLSLEKLSADLGKGRVIATFYTRRAKRIIPLYLFVLSLGCLIGLTMALAGRSQVPPVADHLPFLLSMTYNFYRMSPGYEHTELFGHLWSLCVEEQFYLVYPLAFLFLGRSGRVRMLVLVILACPLGRLGLNLTLNTIGYSEEQIATIMYLCPFSNFDAFSAGCLACCLRRKTSELGVYFWLSIIAVLLLGLVLYVTVQSVLLDASFAYVLRSTFSPEVRGASDQVFMYSFLALLAGTLVILCANFSQSQISLLTAAPLLWLGELSYGIYMYHFPLLYLRSTFLPASVPEPYTRVYGSAVLILYLSALLVISYLSFRYLEKPFLHATGRSRGRWRSALRPVDTDPRI